MKKSSVSNLFALLLMVVVFLVGCSKNEGDSNKNVSAIDPACNPLKDGCSGSGANQASQNITIATLPQGDAKAPLSQYVTFDNGNQIMFSYFALSSLPIDYEKIMQTYSNDYRQANDEFKKHDILNALKPKVDEELAKAKQARYVKVKWDRFPIQGYDFSAKGFPQDQLVNDSNFGWTDGSFYRIELSNGDDFKLLKVADETKARQIEEMRSKYKPMDLIMYLYLQDANLSNNQVKAQVLHISLQDEHGNELIGQ